MTHWKQEGVQHKLPVKLVQSPAGVALNPAPVETTARPNHFHLELTCSPPAQTHNTHTRVFIMLENLWGREDEIYWPLDVPPPTPLVLRQWQLCFSTGLPSWKFIMGVLINLSVCLIWGINSWAKRGCRLERSLSPHTSVASNRRSALTNVWVHTQTDTGEIENLVNHFMLVTAGPCSDTLTVSQVLSPTLSLSRTHAPLSCQRCWQDVCDEGSGWCVCDVNYSHNIHQHRLWSHHLLLMETQML